jgi:hypothetical protein
MIWKKNTLLSVMPADTQQVVDASTLGNVTGTTNNCTYSIWIYINDWSVNYGEEKIIFQRSPSLTEPADLTVSLGPYESTLSITTSILGGAQGYTYIKDVWINGTNPESNGLGWGGNISVPESILTFSTPGVYENTPQNMKAIEKICNPGCDKDPSCAGYNYGHDMNACYYLVNPNKVNLNDYKIPSENNNFAGIKTTSSTHTCIVPNIEIQKWVNITFSASTNNIDIYIDGKLVQSCDLAGEINISNTNNVFISPNGKGFNGWNSRFRFFPKYINPNQAMDIYRKGHGSSNIGNLDYSLKVSLTSGDKQIGSVNI